MVHIILSRYMSSISHSSQIYFIIFLHLLLMRELLSFYILFYTKFFTSRFSIFFFSLLIMEHPIVGLRSFILKCEYLIITCSFFIEVYTSIHPECQSLPHWPGWQQEEVLILNAQKVININ